MNLLFQWATGLGKTKKALDMCKQIYNTNKRIPKILVLVAETTHINNWLNEIQKWKVKTVMRNTTFSCYQSISKHENIKYDIIISDECHHLFSIKRLYSFSKLIYNNIILLSATLTLSEIEILKVRVKNLIIDTKSLNYSINQGKLKEPEIIIKDYSMKAIEKAQYNTLCRKYEWANLIKNEKLKQTFAIQRKRLLAKFKTFLLKEIVASLRKEGTKFICYCASIEQMIEVSNGLNYVSSKNSKKLNCQIIDSFNNNILKELFFCQMGIEGLNLSGIETGIICQCDATTRPFIQKVGRVLRNKINPRIIVCRVKYTKDDDWVKECLCQIK